MNQGSREALWRFLDVRRDELHRADLSDLLSDFASSESVVVELDDVAWLASRLGRPGAVVLPPQSVADFVCALVDGTSIESVLDPWAGAGGLLIPLVRRLHPSSAIGIDPSHAAISLASLVSQPDGIEWRLGASWDALDELPNDFDLVVSCAPLGLKTTQTALPDAAGVSTELKDSLPHLVLLKASTHLASDGFGAFVVGQGFVFQQRPRGVERSLAAFGLHLSAVLSFTGGFRPFDVGVKAALIMVRRGVASDKVLVGELTDDPARIASLASCLETGESSGDLGSGRFVSESELASFDVLAARERAQALATRAGLRRVELSDIALGVHLGDRQGGPGFDDCPNAIYLPLIGRSDVVRSSSELTLKPQNYVQIVLDPEVADARFVAGFFNTALGHAIRDSLLSGVTIPKITKGSLGSALVYLPDLSTQENVVQTSTRVEALEAELSGLKNRLWNAPRGWKSVRDEAARVNKEERFPDWLETLPFPLASILWAYHALSDAPKDQYERLDHFFEALAEFTATILLSGFSTDRELLHSEWAAVSNDMERYHQSIEVSTFGAWVSIAGHFSNLARRMLSAGGDDRGRCCEFFRLSDPDPLLRIFSGKVIGLMQNANAKRNDWIGHTGIVGEEQAKQRLAVLEGYLTELRSTLGDAWSHLNLIIPRGMKQQQGVFHISADCVMGVKTPFVSATFKLDHSVEDGRLHLIGQEERSALQLLPFVRIMPSPSTAQNACYYFNRIEAGKSRYVSYHFERDSDVLVDLPDLVEAIHLLS